MDPLATFIKDPEALELINHLEMGHTRLGQKRLPQYAQLENEFEALVKKKLQEQVPEVDFQPSSDLTADQNSKIASSINKSLILITGGPGTGKTYTAAKLVRQLEGKIKHIIFAAPTGKAAQRLKESFKSDTVDALTLHRLLGREDDPVILPYDLIVVDEASMIDLKMMVQLLKSVKKGARILFLGDVNQLPPVDAGAPFQALVELFEKHFQITPLTQCLRSELKELIDLADLTVKGEADKVIDFLKQNTNPSIQLKALVIPSQFPILTPLKWGPYGVEKLNRLHLAKFKGDAKPIMILENNEELELFNGDIGYIIDGKAHFHNRTLPITICPKYQLAFAISIHKSQGSEFEEIHIVLPEGSEKFGRNLLYTALTRAKKRVFIYADVETLRKTILTSSHREVSQLTL